MRVRASSASNHRSWEPGVPARVIQGLTNPEIARQMFISRRTAEATLSRVYRKLGIRARAELARALPTASNRVDPPI